MHVQTGTAPQKGLVAKAGEARMNVGNATAFIQDLGVDVLAMEQADALRNLLQAKAGALFFAEAMLERSLENSELAVRGELLCARSSNEREVLMKLTLFYKEAEANLDADFEKMRVTINKELRAEGGVDATLADVYQKYVAGVNGAPINMADANVSNGLEGTADAPSENSGGNGTVLGPAISMFVFLVVMGV